MHRRAANSTYRIVSQVLLAAPSFPLRTCCRSADHICRPGVKRANRKTEHVQHTCLCLQACSTTVLGHAAHLSWGTQRLASHLLEPCSNHKKRHYLYLYVTLFARRFTRKDILSACGLSQLYRGCISQAQEQKRVPAFSRTATADATPTLCQGRRLTLRSTAFAPTSFNVRQTLCAPAVWKKLHQLNTCVQPASMSACWGREGTLGWRGTKH